MGDFFQRHWGDMASVAGLGITFWTFMKVRSVSVAADAARREMRERLSSFATLSDVSAAISMMDEIKRLHRAKGWQVRLERYSALRKLLLGIHTYNTALTKDQKTVLIAAVSQFKIIEDRVERACASGKEDDLKLAQFNRMVTQQIDALDQLLISIKQAGV